MFRSSSALLYLSIIFVILSIFSKSLSTLSASRVLKDQRDSVDQLLTLFNQCRTINELFPDTNLAKQSVIWCNSLLNRVLTILVQFARFLVIAIAHLYSSISASVDSFRDYRTLLTSLEYPKYPLTSSRQPFLSLADSRIKRKQESKKN